MRRNPDLGDAALGALLRYSGAELADLDINGWKDASEEALKGIPAAATGLRRLDVSWCRAVDDWFVKSVLEQCGDIEIARLWGHPSAFWDADAACWLHGTDVQREFQDDVTPPTVRTRSTPSATNQLGIDAFTGGYRQLLSCGSPSATRICGPATEPRWVSPCVLARLFSRFPGWRAFHGLSMVPVADAFNHVHHNHAQPVSECDVCPSCRSLSECLHDCQSGMFDGEEVLRSSVSPSIDASDTVDMITVCSVPPGVEVFNTYGATLGNAALLARYGFVLDGSETDTVTFGWPGSSLELEPGQEGKLWEKAYGMVQNFADSVISGSSLVYVPDTDTERSRALSISSDGQISVALFVWAIVDALPQEVLEAQANMVLCVYSALMRLEALRDVDDEDEDAQGRGHDRVHDPDAVGVLTAAAGRLKRLCRTRAANMGAEQYRGASLEATVEVLDDIPEDREKTRLAVEYLLSARRILGACAAD